MADYSLAQLTQLVNQLIERVSALDGIGLAQGAQGQVPAMQTQVNGVRKDMKANTTLLEQQLAQVRTQLATFNNSLGKLVPAV